MASARVIWLTIGAVLLGVALTAIILGTEIRIEREVKVAGPDLPVYYMIRRGEPIEAIERELSRNPRLATDAYVINSTLLGHAAGVGRLDVVRLLLEMGADPNGHGRPGEDSPLASAVANEHADVVSVLVEHGADPHLKESFGVSPLQVAETVGNPTILSLLSKATPRSEPVETEPQLNGVDKESDVD